MNAPVRTDERRFEHVASLRVSTGPLAAPVLIRVVSMVLTRANCPLDRLEDALLVCDALSAHAPAHASDGHLAFAVATRPEGMELRVSALAVDGARRLVEDSAIPGVGNVLERVTDELRFEAAADAPGEDLVLAFDFG